MKSCVECRNFHVCEDPKRRFDYHCSNFAQMKTVRPGSILDMVMVDGEEDEASPPPAYAPATGDKFGKYLNMDSDELSKRESSLLDMVDEVMTNPSPVPPDLKFDDRDHKEFKNVLHWAIDKKGANQPPFARQIAIGLHLFAEWCPRCSHERMRNIYTIPYRSSVEKLQDAAVLLEHGVCPKCGVQRAELIRNKELKWYTDFAGCLGQRAGKSATIYAYIAPYVVHKYLKLQNPCRVFGIMENSIISATFVGLTFARAVSLLWAPLHNILSKSEWFIEYHKHLEYLAVKHGIENLYSFKETFIKYMHRNMFLYPLGPNKRTLRGDNRFFGAVDELGWFYMGSDDDEERERASGKEVWTSLDRSMKTVRTAGKKLIYDKSSGRNFNTLPGAYLCGVSSPSHAKDMIMSLVRTHEDSEDVLTLHLPSWQYNPLYESKDDFAKEYREDPVRAERDFGANPPDAINPFFSDVSATQKAFSGEGNKAGYEYTLGQPPEDSNLYGIAQYKWANLFNIRTGTQVPPSILTLDAGQTNNSFCLTVQTRDQAKQKGVRPKIRVPLVIEIAPRKGREVINFTKVYQDVIKPIIQEFNVCYVLADRWQSTKVLQDIEDDFKIPTQVYSLKYLDMTTVRSYLVADDAPIIMPPPEVPFKEIRGLAELDYPHGFQYKPLAHLYHQLATIRGFPRSVEKGEGQTDDIWRALSLGLKFMVDDEWCTKNLKGRIRRGRGSTGVVGGLGSAGSSHQGQTSRVGSVGSRSGGGSAPSNGGSSVFARR